METENNMNLTKLNEVIDALIEKTNQAPYNGSDDWTVGIKVNDSPSSNTEIVGIMSLEFGEDWNSGKIILSPVIPLYTSQSISVEVPLVVSEPDSNTDKDSEIEMLKKQVQELQDIIIQLKG